MSKPTALAAFAASQQRGGLSKTETGGRNLTQVKIPSLNALGDAIGDVGTNRNQLKGLNPLGEIKGLGSPVKPLKVLNELRTSGEGASPSHKLVASAGSSTPSEPDKVNAGSNSESIKKQAPRRRSSAKPLASTSIQGGKAADEIAPNADEVVRKEQDEVATKAVDVAAQLNAETSSVRDETSPTESAATGVKAPPGDDDSDDDDFNFDDVEGEEEDAKAKADSGEQGESSTCVTAAKPAAVNVDDLYDYPPDLSNEATHNKQPKMFLPRASEIELFHVVLAEDTDQLERFLEEISPQEMLDIVDSAGRNLYHYAALSKDKLVQDLIFQHVNSYRDREFEMELKALMRKKDQTNRWMQENKSNGNGWVPPRVKELQREMTKQKCVDWARICSSVDENGRSFFHYFATTASLVPIEDDYEFCSVLRSKPTILSTKDNFKKLALHYAVESGNLKQVKWYFQMGVRLSQADVDLLFSFNVSRVMENTILRHLESIDIQNYYSLASRGDIEENGNYCDPGVSTFVLAKLQRITDDSAGRLHQLPLHRAAMFGNVRAVELLLEEGADPSARDANQWTPLHYCAEEASENHLTIARLLMETPQSVDVNARSLKGRSPLHVAVHSRKRKMLHDYDDTHLTRASSVKDRVSFVAYLHECKADLDLRDASGATPLLLACRGDDVDVAEFLLRAGSDPTVRGDNRWNPLHFAAIRGNPSMVSFLQFWDADSRLWNDSPGIQGRKPMDVAKSDDVRQILVNLWTECYSGNVDQVRRLLLAHSKRGPKPPEQIRFVSVKDKTAQTERSPLHLTVVGYMDALQSQETSSSSNSSREERLKYTKSSELKRTAPSRFLQVVILLLQAGADLCGADKWGITPLMLAASLKDTVLMETLLDRISEEDDLLAIDAQGNTALHHSYAFCQAQVSTMLEDQMDDVEIENKLGKSPFEMTGYHEKVYPKEYRDFLKRQQNLRRRQQDFK
ncbi:hypothetical protein PR003_g2479 [Phytophthora rubi]|uniref:Uncharacterized protein n=1 Tax=Phytophthora rubi TaxID=129364 RepID=A0A6A3PD06_9STRA|nr:hypothetical protein PR002_g2508 [Phytophthora rubi]KAE9051443.1 hypothetical protein PR001_g1444 [Phytophthora rubi]KAE9356147.1 hypothetical protein PR003_g2479 [Phytophthora rubi]